MIWPMTVGFSTTRAATRHDLRNQGDVIGSECRGNLHGRVVAGLHGIDLELDDVRFRRTHHLGPFGFGVADSPGQRSDATVGAGVAVTADERHAGQGDAALGGDDMRDSLSRITDVEESQLQVADVGARLAQHLRS